MSDHYDSTPYHPLYDNPDNPLRGLCDRCGLPLYAAQESSVIRGMHEQCALAELEWEQECLEICEAAHWAEYAFTLGYNFAQTAILIRGMFPTLSVYQGGGVVRDEANEQPGAHFERRQA